MKIRTILPSVLLVLSAMARTATAQPHDFEVVDGKVRFSCEGPTVTLPARGNFGAVASKLTFDSQKLSTSKGYAEVTLASVNTNDSGWDFAFRHAGFLGLEDFPRSRFTVTGVTPVDKPIAGRWNLVTIQGEMMLHGVRRKISVPGAVIWASVSGAEPEELAIRAYFHIRWDEYDIPVPDGATRLFAGDGASVDVELKFRRIPTKRAR